MLTPAKRINSTSVDYTLEPHNHLTTYLVQRGLYKDLRDALLRMVS